MAKKPRKKPTKKQRPSRGQGKGFKWTEELEQKLLSRLMNGFSVGDTINGVCSRSTLYKRIRTDEDWADRWENAKETGNDAIRDEVARRGMRGVLEPVYHEGRVVGRRRKYSDNLLMFYAKSRMPEFRENVHVSDGTFNPDGMAERLASKFAAIIASRSGNGTTQEPE